jgi:hypothetical protein
VQGVLAALAVTDLRHEVADQRFGNGAAQACHGLLGSRLHPLGQFRGEIGDLVQALESGLGNPFGGGILVEHLQDPAGGDIVGERCQFGKDTGQEIVEPIDRLGGLFDLGL